MWLGLRVGLLFLMRGIFLGGTLLLRGILPGAEDGAGGVIFVPTRGHFRRRRGWGGRGDCGGVGGSSLQSRPEAGPVVMEPQ